MAADASDLNMDAPSDLQDIQDFPDSDIQLLPPPPATYPDKLSLLAAVHAHGKTHGYRVVVKSSTSPNDQKPGRTSKVWLRCDRGGQYRPRNGLTEETRKRRRTSRLTDCPFSLLAAGTPGFWTLTITDPRHNHGPITERPRPVPQQKIKKGQLSAQPYDWPHDASFTPFTTALVIIDMQKDFCAPGGYLEYQGYDISQTRAIIPKLQHLLQSMRSAGFAIYHTREGHRPDLSTLSSRESYRSRNNPSALGIGSQGPLGRLLIRGERGHDTIDELYPIPGEPVIDKPGRGAFAHTDFELILRNKGIRNLLLTGVTTDVCVSTTMREANDRGFDCVIVEDACASADSSLHSSTIDSVKEEGGVFGSVTSVNDVLQALENFKKVTVQKLAPQLAAQMGT